MTQKRPTLESAQAALSSLRLQENIFAFSVGSLPDFAQPDADIDLNVSVSIMGNAETIMNGLIQVMRGNPNTASIVKQAVEIFIAEQAKSPADAFKSFFVKM